MLLWEFTEVVSEVMDAEWEEVGGFGGGGLEVVR